MGETISWDQFEAVELRVGTVVEAEEFPEARIPAYKLTTFNPASHFSYPFLEADEEEADIMDYSRN